jgi:hypothetical protein
MQLTDEQKLEVSRDFQYYALRPDSIEHLGTVRPIHNVKPGRP